MPRDGPDDEGLTIIRGLLDSNWDNTNTSYSSDPHRFTTGWWDWARDEPTVTITTPNVNPQSQQTGVSYVTGDGGVGQRYSGTCLVNGWAGTFNTDALAGEGDGGGFLSPKILAWDFCKEIRRILGENHAGTTNADGTVELTYVMPGAYRRIVESNPDDENPALFRYEVTARYGFEETHRA